MKTFLALFTCGENSKNHQEWMKLDEKTKKERLEKGYIARDEWWEKHKDRIIYDGGPLAEITKQIDRQGTRDIPSQMGAFIVVEADSYEDAAKMFLDHPHFAIFPGTGVEILERRERK